MSCAIIYFLMFAKSMFCCNLSRCFCFSLGSERLAGEDGCNSGYCFGTSESFVSKISVFFEYNVLLVYVLKRFRPGLQQVYKGFLRVLCPHFLLENPQSENVTYHPRSFFLCPASKKPTAFNYSTF